MRDQATELCIELESIRALRVADEALPVGELPARIADALIMQARGAPERRPLTIRFIAPDAAAADADRVAALASTHFTRLAERHTQQVRDIFRFARVATVLGLLCVVVLIACAQAIPDDAGKLMLGLRESLNIFAWVAMWRPAELWLYAHLPERHWRRLALRLAAAAVRVERAGQSGQPG